MEKFKDKTNFVSKEGILCILFKDQNTNQNQDNHLMKDKNGYKGNTRCLS